MNGFACLTPDRHLAGLAALAEHPHQAGSQVESGQVEADQFGQAQAGGVEQFQQRLIATGNEVILDAAIERARRYLRTRLFSAVRTSGEGTRISPVSGSICAWRTVCPLVPRA